MNDRIILDASKEIALREKAFTWFFAAMDENKTGEKEDWCRTVKESISRLYSSDNDVDFNIHLLHELFSLGPETFPIHQLQGYVDYLWKNKEHWNKIKPILDSICKSNSPDIIRYLVEKDGHNLTDTTDTTAGTGQGGLQVPVNPFHQAQDWRGLSPCIIPHIEWHGMSV